MNELRKKIEAVLAPLRMAEVVGEPIEGAWLGVDALRSLQQEMDSSEAGCDTGMNLWRYQLPSIKHEGWAVFLLSSNGMLAVCSDFGNYAHHWRDCGEEDFRQFLINCHTEYVLRKLCSYPVFRADDTQRLIREKILYLRSIEDLRQAQARKEWDLTDQIHDEVSFSVWWQETTLADASELAVYGISTDLELFGERVWPRFVKMLENIRREA